MLPYWLLFSAFCAGAIQYRKPDQGARRAGLFLVVGALAVALMIGLRYKVGGDWIAYEGMFRDAAYFELSEALSQSDPGYIVVNWLGNQLGLDVWFVNLVCGLIFTWGLVKFARAQANPWLAMVVAIPYLVIVVAMGYTRQGVAIGLIMAALAAERQSMVRLTIYIFFAALFHKTAVLVLPIVALSMNRAYFVNGLVLALSGWLFYTYFLETSVDLLVSRYLEAQWESQGALIRVVMNLIPAGIFLLFHRRFDMSDQQRRLWLSFSLLAVGLLVLLMVLPSSTAVDRVALYVIPLQLVVLSRLPDAFHDKGKRNFQVLIFVIAYSALVQYVWLNFAHHAYDWIPYRAYSPLPDGDTGSMVPD